MISPLDPNAVLSELGDKFLRAVGGAVRGARDDIEELRDAFPSWVAPMHPRVLSNIIQDRVWNRLVHALIDDPTVTPFENGATRELQVGRHFRFRVKRHTKRDRISSYPTPTDLRFWRQDRDTFEGLELVTLCAGYRWDDDLREILAPVISYREGKRNVVWAMELDEPAADGGALPIGWTPMPPTLPTIDLGTVARRDKTEGEK